MELSEEEKKAIVIINALKQWQGINYIVKSRHNAKLNYNEVCLLLNLIEKNKIIMMKYYRGIDLSKDEEEYVERIIEEDERRRKESC